MDPGNLISIRGVDHYYQWVPSSTPEQNKPVMVFIHGWAGSARYWQSTAWALADSYDCLLYDLRGFGRSKLPQDNPSPLDYELETYGEDLKVLLDTLGLNRVTINSHSMGASIATVFANLHPSRVEKLILTCNGVFEYEPKSFAAFHRFGGYVVKYRYDWFKSFPWADRLFMARFLQQPIEAEERRAFLEDFLLADYEAALGTIYTSVSKEAAEIMPQAFANLSVPTLLISGEKDQITPASLGKKAAASNQKIEYYEIAQTGHFPMLEAPEVYLTKVREFLCNNVKS